MILRTSDFDYDLPEELIAQTPLEPRDHSKLMLVERDVGALSHDRFLISPNTYDKVTYWFLTIAELSRHAFLDLGMILEIRLSCYFCLG